MRSERLSKGKDQMTQTKPFAELAAKAKADPVRRARIEESTRAIDAALALAELRNQRGVTQREADEIGIVERDTGAVGPVVKVEDAGNR